VVYNRKTKLVYDEKESLFLKILYSNVVGRGILKVFTLKWFTNLGKLYMNSKLSKLKIKRFIKKNNINMDEYEVAKYNSFDEFFTRRIKSNKRPISDNKKDLVSPCDSKLSVYEITEDKLFNIKGSTYTLEELLEDKELANKYLGGYMLVFRLCVDDYHHYYYIDNGKRLSTKYIKGKFHTVRPIAHKYVKVFKENCRELTVLDTENFGQIVQMEVGAMMVGKICNLDKNEFKRGDEKGYFRFGGSTVILIFEKDKIELDKDILEKSKEDIEVKVQLFETIGRGC